MKKMAAAVRVTLLLVAAFAIMVFIGHVMRQGDVRKLAACEERASWLFYGHCEMKGNEACEVVWQQHLGGGETPIEVYGVSPISCAQAGTVPWVHAVAMGPDTRDSFAFICAPAPSGAAP